MPKMKFDAQENSYPNVGRHLFKVDTIFDLDKDGNKKQTKSGYDLWKIKLVVIEGPEKGKKAILNIPFSPTAQKIIDSFFYKGFGIKCIDATDHEVDFKKEDILNKKVYAEITASDINGCEFNPFNYEKYESEEENENENENKTDEDLPF